MRFARSLFAFVFLLTNVVLGHAVESQFWADRRRSVERKSSGTLLAALPKATAPVFSGLGIPAPVLPKEIQKVLSSAFLSTHGDLLRSLPFAHGSIRSVSPARNGAFAGPVVIHVQDIHQNLEAQRNIASAVSALAPHVDVLALEGTTRRIDLGRFRRFPDRQAVRVVADEALIRNDITGPIHAGLVSTGAFPDIVGVDDAGHYAANIEAYRQSVPRLNPLKKELARRWDANTQEASRFLNPALRVFHDAVCRYRDGRSSLTAYLSALTAETAGRSMPSDFDDFNRALAMESRLDFSRVENERAQMIGVLAEQLSSAEMTDLSNRGMAYRAGRVRYADFYRYLETLCATRNVALSRFPALRDYIHYVLVADRVNADRLFAQTAEVERRAYAGLIKNADERRLIEESRRLYLTGKLLDFSLTPQEWRDYASQALVSPPGAGPSTEGAPMIDGHDLASFENFYREALARDDAMAKNVLALTASCPSTVVLLVTGGYHAPGLTERLTRSGATVVSFVPKVEKIEDKNGTTALGIFTREKMPLQKLFEGNTLFLGQDPAAPSVVGFQIPAETAAATAAPTAFKELAPSAVLSNTGKTEKNGGIFRVWLKGKMGWEVAFNPSASPGKKFRGMFIPLSVGGILAVFAVTVLSGFNINSDVIRAVLVLVPLSLLAIPLLSVTKKFLGQRRFSGGTDLTSKRFSFSQFKGIFISLARSVEGVFIAVSVLFGGPSAAAPSVPSAPAVLAAPAQTALTPAVRESFFSALRDFYWTIQVTPQNEAVHQRSRAVVEQILRTYPHAVSELFSREGGVDYADLYDTLGLARDVAALVARTSPDPLVSALAQSASVYVDRSDPGYAEKQREDITRFLQVARNWESSGSAPPGGMDVLVERVFYDLNRMAGEAVENSELMPTLVHLVDQLTQNHPQSALALFAESALLRLNGATGSGPLNFEENFERLMGHLETLAGHPAYSPFSENLLQSRVDPSITRVYSPWKNPETEVVKNLLWSLSHQSDRQLLSPEFLEKQLTSLQAFVQRVGEGHIAKGEDGTIIETFRFFASGLLPLESARKIVDQGIDHPLFVLAVKRLQDAGKADKKSVFDGSSLNDLLAYVRLLYPPQPDENVRRVVESRLQDEAAFVAEFLQRDPDRIHALDPRAAYALLALRGDSLNPQTRQALYLNIFTELKTSQASPPADLNTAEAASFDIPPGGLLGAYLLSPHPLLNAFAQRAREDKQYDAIKEALGAHGRTFVHLTRASAQTHGPLRRALESARSPQSLLRSFVLAMTMLIGAVAGPLSMGDGEARAAEKPVFADGAWTVLGAVDTGPSAKSIQAPFGRFTELKIMRGGSQVGSIKGNGYYRITPPGTTWGTSFVTPGYWTGATYYHNSDIKSLKMSVDGKGQLEMTGRMESAHFVSDDFTIVFLNGDPKNVAIEVSFSVKAKTNFALTAGRFPQAEAFKAFQFSSMNVGPQFDADVAKVDGLTGTVSAHLAKSDALFYQSPVPVGEGSRLTLSNDGSGRPRNTPTTYVKVLDKPTGLYAQGWVTRSNDPDDDNVGAWLGRGPLNVGYWIGDKLNESYRAGDLIGRYHFEAGAHPPATARKSVTGDAALAVSVNEKTFKSAQSNVATMKEFIRAYLASQGYAVTNEGWLSGFAPYYSEGNRNRSFSDFQGELNAGRIKELTDQGSLKPKRGGTWIDPDFKWKEYPIGRWYARWMAGGVESLGLLVGVGMAVAYAMGIPDLSFAVPQLKEALILSLATGSLSWAIFRYGHYFFNRAAMDSEDVRRIGYGTIGVGLLAGLPLINFVWGGVLFAAGVLVLTARHFGVNRNIDSPRQEELWTVNDDGLSRVTKAFFAPALLMALQPLLGSLAGYIGSDLPSWIAGLWTSYYTGILGALLVWGGRILGGVGDRMGTRPYLLTVAGIGLFGGLPILLPVAGYGVTIWALALLGLGLVGWRWRDSGTPMSPSIKSFALMAAGVFTLDQFSKGLMLVFAPGPFVQEALGLTSAIGSLLAHPGWDQSMVGPLIRVLSEDWAIRPAFHMVATFTDFGVILTVLFVVLAIKIQEHFSPMPPWILAVFVGGALGNIVDLMRLGGAWDWISYEPVFGGVGHLPVLIPNLADLFILCGLISGIIFIGNRVLTTAAKRSRLKSRDPPGKIVIQRKYFLALAAAMFIHVGVLTGFEGVFNRIAGNFHAISQAMRSSVDPLSDIQDPSSRVIHLDDFWSLSFVQRRDLDDQDLERLEILSTISTPQAVILSEYREDLLLLGDRGRLDLKNRAWYAHANLDSDKRRNLINNWPLWNQWRKNFSSDNAAYIAKRLQDFAISSAQVFVPLNSRVPPASQEDSPPLILLGVQFSIMEDFVRHATIAIDPARPPLNVRIALTPNNAAGPHPVLQVDARSNSKSTPLRDRLPVDSEPSVVGTHDDPVFNLDSSLEADPAIIDQARKELLAMMRAVRLKAMAVRPTAPTPVPSVLPVIPSHLAGLEQEFNRARKSTDQMKQFARKYLAVKGYAVRAPGWLSGFAMHYSQPIDGGRAYSVFMGELTDDKITDLARDGILSRLSAPGTNRTNPRRPTSVSKPTPKRAARETVLILSNPALGRRRILAQSWPYAGELGLAQLDGAAERMRWLQNVGGFLAEPETRSVYEREVREALRDSPPDLNDPQSIIDPLTEFVLGSEATLPILLEVVSEESLPEVAKTLDRLAVLNRNAERPVPLVLAGNTAAVVAQLKTTVGESAIVHVVERPVAADGILDPKALVAGIEGIKRFPVPANATWVLGISDKIALNSETVNALGGEGLGKSMKEALLLFLDRLTRGIPLRPGDLEILVDVAAVIQSNA